MSEEKNMYYGRGTAEMFDDYLDFINYVFGFEFALQGGRYEPCGVGSQRD